MSFSTRSLMISEHCQSQYCLLRHVFHKWLSCRFQTTDCLTWPASLWSFLLDATQSIPPPSGSKGAMRDCIKRLTEVSGDIIHCPLCILRACCSVIEDRFTGLIFHYLICLSIPSHLFVPWVPRNGFQNLLIKLQGTEVGLTSLSLHQYSLLSF